MTTATPEMTVLLAGEADSNALPPEWESGGQHVRVLGLSEQKKAKKARRLFVVSYATELDAVADCVKHANRANRLQGLLVHSDVELPWLSRMFERADLRILRNLIVHAQWEPFRRVLRASALGAPEDFIADATVVGDHLKVITCAHEALEISFQAYPALQRIALEDRDAFEIQEDGLLLYWANADVHLDVDAIRTANDPDLQVQLWRRRTASDEALGKAIRAMRDERGITQDEIEGLSERQLRRIEKGASASEHALDSLARAHGMSSNAYLNALSEKMDGSESTSEAASSSV